MDIPRPELARARRRRRILVTLASLIGLAAITVGLSRLKPALPSVDGGSLYKGTVTRGEMLRQVRGNGTLVPEDIHWTPAMTTGRIENIRVLPGAAVKADSIILELSNPEVKHAEFEAVWKLKEAEAQFAKLKVQLESERLSQEATAAGLKAECSVAKLDAEADEKLFKEKLVDELTSKRSRAKADQLIIRCDLEEKRLQIVAESHKAQLAAEEAQLATFTAQLELKRSQAADLQVRAGIDGILQRLGEQDQLRAGQQVMAGANLARVANPARLKAEVKIVETQAKDVLIDQVATIDTRNGVIRGHVTRIDPAVQNGTVTVDVALDGPLPKGARPDLSVEGTIELERLENVLYVGRPVNGQAESTVGIFKLAEGGREATRVPVKLGRTSVNFVEIVDGLNIGDIIILSDMSQWDSHDRVRLN